MPAQIQEWWFDGSGRNMLAGDPIDPNNLPLMDDDHILDFLRRIPDAIVSFNRLVPTMTVIERIRLNDLASRVRPQLDEKDFIDVVQGNWNRKGVRSRGPASLRGPH